MSRWRAVVKGGVAAAILCAVAGCASEIPVPAYAYHVGKSSLPPKVGVAKSEIPLAPQPADYALPKAAVLDTWPGAPPSEAPNPGPFGPAPDPPEQPSSEQATTGQASSGQASSGQASSGQTATTGADKTAPLVRDNDVRLTKKKCPTVAKPPYPDEAKKARAEGLVTAKCLVETDGSLTCEATWSTAPALTKPVLDNLAQQKVTPFTLKDGTKVRVECSYSYRYKP